MTKIDQMIDEGIPVIVDESDEATGAYSFTSMTEYQRAMYELIVRDDEVYTILPDTQTISADGIMSAKVTTTTSVYNSLHVDVITIDEVAHVIDTIAGRAEMEFTSSTPDTIIRLDYHGQKAIIEAV